MFITLLVIQSIHEVLGITLPLSVLFTQIDYKLSVYLGTPPQSLLVFPDTHKTVLPT